MYLPIEPVTQLEVKQEISCLKIDKSPGYDCIDAKVIQLLMDKVVDFLTKILNSMICLDHFPSQWKYAEIIMVPKPNKPESPYQFVAYIFQNI